MLVELGWAVVHVTAKPGASRQQVENEVEKALTLIANGDYEKVILD